MQIRSITLGIEARAHEPTAATVEGGRFLRAARAAFSAAGLPPQTTRLSTQPAHLFLAPDALLRFCRALEAGCAQADIDYCAVGAIALGGAWTPEATADAVSSALIDTERTFSSIQLLKGSGSPPPPSPQPPTPNPHVDYAALRASARVIARVARATPDGFGNLRFAAAAHIPPNAPFFPVAYHAGGPPAFSLALQAADLAVQAFAGDDSLDHAERRLAERLQAEGAKLAAVAESIERSTGVRYAGLDLSLAPFPSAEESIGTALEALGLESVGAPGRLAAAALLTRALRAAAQGVGGWGLGVGGSAPGAGAGEKTLDISFGPQTPDPKPQTPLRAAGLSGLMLPVLEDAVLAQRASEGVLSLSDLLLYSAVCGTGLDTVPLPGDLSEEALAGILLDVAALSLALSKPLTARLFPVPGKAAGDLTEFDFPFFANARVLPVPPFSASRLIARGLRSQA